MKAQEWLDEGCEQINNFVEISQNWMYPAVLSHLQVSFGLSEEEARRELEIFHGRCSWKSIEKSDSRPLCSKCEAHASVYFAGVNYCGSCYPCDAEKGV